MITSLVLSAIATLISLIGTAIMTFAVEALTAIPDYTLDIENVINGYSVNGNLTSLIYNTMSAAGFALLTLGFAWKGFQTYILYTDGDPEADPLQLLTLYCKGVAVIFGFDIILKKFIEGLNKVIDDLLTIIKNNTNTNTTIDDMVDALFSLDENNVKSGLISGIMGIIFGIIAIVVFFTCLKNGIELYILKVGLPLAVIGLLNQDKGVFKGYFMSLSKALVTILVKIVCCQLGYSIMMAATDTSIILNATIDSIMGMILGIIILLVALTAPKLLGEFMVPSGGGQGFMMKAYYTSSMVSRVKNIFK